MTFNHSIHGWILACESNDGYVRIPIHYLSILTFFYISYIQIGLVRLITRDRYILQSFTNFPILSKSLREFWSRRYNQLVSSVFRESVFQPIRSYSSSPTIAALTVFILSGLLHVHRVLMVSDNLRYVFPTFAFFHLAWNCLHSRGAFIDSSTILLRLVDSKHISSSHSTSSNRTLYKKSRIFRSS